MNIHGQEWHWVQTIPRTRDVRLSPLRPPVRGQARYWPCGPPSAVKARYWPCGPLSAVKAG
jgi:hypothetical protein